MPRISEAQALAYECLQGSQNTAAAEAALKDEVPSLGQEVDE